jgi:hypothetical protein
MGGLYDGRLFVARVIDASTGAIVWQTEPAGFEASSKALERVREGRYNLFGMVEVPSDMTRRCGMCRQVGNAAHGDHIPAEPHVCDFNSGPGSDQCGTCGASPAQEGDHAAEG